MHPISRVSGDEICAWSDCPSATQLFEVPIETDIWKIMFESLYNRCQLVGTRLSHSAMFEVVKLIPMATKDKKKGKVKDQVAYVSHYSTSIQLNCLQGFTGQQSLAWRLAAEAPRMTSDCVFSRPQTCFVQAKNPDA